MSNQSPLPPVPFLIRARVDDVPSSSCLGSSLTLEVLEGPGGLGDPVGPALGLLAGEAWWAEGQLCWLRQREQSGPTGRHTCWPRPTSSRLISLHSSLEGGGRRREREGGRREREEREGEKEEREGGERGERGYDPVICSQVL